MALSYPFRSVLAANSTSTGFTAQNTTTTEPTGTGVLDLCSRTLGWGGPTSPPAYVQIVPYGTDGNDDTFSFRVYGYNATDAATKVYVPQLLLDAAVVLSVITGTDFAANTFLADTITITQGVATGSAWCSLISPGNDTVASIALHTRGFRYLKFDWDLAGAQEAASMNALIRPFEI